MQSWDDTGAGVPFWESEWQGIPSESLGVAMHTDQLAEAGFYDAFYSRLFEQYRSFDQLPSDWCQAKRETAGVLASLLPPASAVLSYGCGLGVVEREIAR